MKDITKWIAITIAVILLALAVTSAYASQSDNVTICHATGSQNNPYQKITVDDDAVNGIGNGDHNTSQHQGGADIIPPGYWDANGRNWTQQNIAIYNNNCNIPQPTPTPTMVQPTPTMVIPTPTEEPCDGCCEKECEVTPTPTEEVTPTPTPEDTGGSSVGDAPLTNNTTGAPSCPNGKTVNLVANPHVWRNGSQATVNFFITEGDSANIYYREEGVNGWTHSVLQSEVKKYVNGDKYVSYTIYGLNPQLGYDFGIEQVNGCGGGQVLSVVVDGPQPRLFMFSYWEWLSL